VNPISVLVVGTLGGGGIHQYVEKQREQLRDRDDVEVAVYDMVTPESHDAVRVAAALFRCLWAAIRFPFRTPPDVLHVHASHQFSFYRASFYVLFGRYVWGRPVVLHIHGSSFDDFAESDSVPVSGLQSLVFSAAENVIVLSEYWSEVVSPYVPEEDVSVVPNAVNPEEYEPTFDPPVQRVVFVSNLKERKGVRELVDAVETLTARTEVPFEVSIAGKGPLSELVEGVAETHENVTYHGYVSESEKRRLLSESSIFVLPTYAEGLPIAILEAMAGGNAVLSTSVGSIPEVITEENGVLVEPGDTEALTDALEALVRSPETVAEQASRNRELVEERYSWETVTVAILDIYDAQVERPERLP